MTNREVAMKYLRCFCAGDIDGLIPLLAVGLNFIGTVHTYGSASEYLESLLALLLGASDALFHQARFGPLT